MKIRNMHIVDRGQTVLSHDSASNDALELAKKFADLSDDDFAEELIGDSSPPPNDESAILAELDRIATNVRDASVRLGEQEKRIAEAEADIRAAERTRSTGGMT